MTHEDKLRRIALDAVEQAMEPKGPAMAKPYSTPDEFDCWFCGERNERDGTEQVLCDEAICSVCEFEGSAADKINEVHADLCAELVALRKYRYETKKIGYSLLLADVAFNKSQAKGQNPVYSADELVKPRLSAEDLMAKTTFEQRKDRYGKIG